MNDWLADIESRVSVALTLRDRDEALDTQHDICRDDVPRLLAAIRRLTVERDQWRDRAEGVTA